MVSSPLGVDDERWGLGVGAAGLDSKWTTFRPGWAASGNRILARLLLFSTASDAIGDIGLWQRRCLLAIIEEVVAILRRLLGGELLPERLDEALDPIVVVWIDCGDFGVDCVG